MDNEFHARCIIVKDVRNDTGIRCQVSADISFGFSRTLFALALLVTTMASFPVSIAYQCSAQVFKRAGCHLKRGHLVR